MPVTQSPTLITCSCGNGPFFHVPARQYPDLCLDCADDRSRQEQGWTVTNSVD